MESWSFPPAYDDGYCPRALQPLLVSRSARPCRLRARRFSFSSACEVVCDYAYEHAPFYRRKWDEAGFHPIQLRSLEDFESKVPVVEKKDLRAAQEQRAAVRRLPVHAGSRDFPHPRHQRHHRPAHRLRHRPPRLERAIANAHARIMWAMGSRPGDTICVAAIFTLYMGSWGALAGRRAAGRARPFRSAPASPGMSARCVHVAQHDQADRILRHADLCLASCRGGRRRRPQPTRFPPQDHVLFRRAGRLDSRRARQNRRALRRQGHRLRLHGGNDAVDERGGDRRDLRPVVLAGRGLHGSLRPRHHAPRCLRRARHAGLYPSRAHLAADDPPAVGRSDALDQRRKSVRAHISAPAARESSAASTTCSRSAARTSTRAKSTRP